MLIKPVKAVCAGLSLCATFYFAQSWWTHAGTAEEILASTPEATSEQINTCHALTARMLPPEPYVRDFMKGCLQGQADFAKSEMAAPHQSIEGRDKALSAAFGALTLMLGVASVRRKQKEGPDRAQRWDHH